MKDSQQGRNYNEREIGKLIQRATELHEESIGQSDRNLSLDEVEQLASELGVPAEHLRTAALELEESPGVGRSLWGGPFVVDHDRFIPANLTEEEWSQILLEIRRFMGTSGRDRRIGHAREWVRFVGEGDSGANFESTRVTMEPGERGTSLRIRKQFGGAAVLAYMASLVPAGVFSFLILGEALGPVNLGILAATLSLPVAMRTLIRRSMRKKKDAFKQLADRIQEIVGSTSVKVAPPSASAQEGLSVAKTTPVGSTNELLRIPDSNAEEQSGRSSRQATRG